MNDRLKMQEQAAEAAQQLLHSFRESHPQWTDDRTPLEELAAWLGLHIATFDRDDYPKGTYGFLEAGENLVWLCRNLPEGILRFTLAHEIGHAVLHRRLGQQQFSFRLAQPIAASDLAKAEAREDPCRDYDIREDITDVLFQEQREEFPDTSMSYDPHSQREVAANIFAAELLMPIEKVRALYLTGMVSPNELANTFGVSKSAMLTRLSALLIERELHLYNKSEDGSVAMEEPLRSPVVGRSEPPKKQYDEFQQAAIEAPTPALIVAGPGSGKTSTLIGRVEYLIYKQAIMPENILALTFSRKAAAEMQERLQSVLDEQVNFPTVNTFHAFCADILRTCGSLVGLRQNFACLDNVEGYLLLLRLANELPLRHYQHLNMPTFYFSAITNGISRAKDELVTPATYRSLALRMLEQATSDEQVQRAEKALEVADIYALYQASLERQGDTDLSGLIMLAVQLLQEHPEVRQLLQQKYQHILVDEFQDINRASGVLLSELARDTGRVWVVGDANQAIYGFRGASPANIANFRNDYAGAVVLPLSRNYRSRPDIVSFADAFRSKQLDSDNIQGVVQTVRSNATDPYVTLAVASDDSSELNGLIKDIQRKQAEGYHFRDIVVLCRTRSHVRKISQALLTANLPIIERGGMLEQEYIKNLLSIVMLLADPSGMGLLRAARGPEHALTQSDIETVLWEAKVQDISPMTLIQRKEATHTMSMESSRSLARLSSIIESLYTLQNVWSLLADYLFIETSLLRDLLISAGNAQAQAMLQDYTSILQLARKFDSQQLMLRDQQEQEALAAGEEIEPIKPPAIQEQARGFLEYLAVLLALHHDGGNQHENAEDDQEIPDAIRVMTVHASKGLEFPVVYLPGIVKQRFPLSRRSNSVEPPTNMLAAGSDGDAVHETEEACLFYVGATRARDHLVLSYAERYGKKNYKRSAYIDALVMGLPEERIKRVFWQDTQAVFDLDQPYADMMLIVDNHTGKETAWLNPFSAQPGDHFIESMKPETLTLSELETYLRCPRQYMYGTIYHFHGEKSAYAAFWRATYDTLEELKHQFETHKSAERWDGELLTEEETEELYSKCWQEQKGHTLPFASLYERHGHEVSELIRRKLLASGNTNWQLRQKLGVDIAGKTIEVPVDRIEAPVRDDEPIKFVRTRFGKSKEKPAATTREMLYVHAARQHHPERTIELQLHNMSTGETYPMTLTTKKEQSLYNELAQAIEARERNEFPPKPDVMRCPTCPFFLICPA